MPYLKGERGMKILNLKIFLLILILSLSISYRAEKKAILIGINDYKNLPFLWKERNKTIEDLKGSINDVHLIKEILTTFYGFKEKDLKILTHQEATRENIIKIFNNWFIEGTKEGDTIFYYFSGHGTQVPDQNFDEDDGLDEALCPWDVKPEGARDVIDARLIIDDELGVMFRNLKGRNVIAFVDACHSATVTTRSVEQTPSYRRKFLPVKIEGAQRGMKSFSLNIPRQKDIPNGQIFFFSSKEEQASYEFYFPSGFHGVFTFYLAEELKKERGAIKYAELYNRVKILMEEKARKGILLLQEPEIEPPSGPILENVVFGESIPSPSPPKFPDKPLSEIKGERLLLRFESMDRMDSLERENLKNWLNSLQYVELTEEPYFDRLIRGEKREGFYHLRILNRIGDATRISPTNNLNKLKEELKTHLEYAYLVKQLAYVRNPSPSFKIRVWVTDEKRQDFKIGEKVFFNFYSERDCYLLLLNLDSRGNFHIIFPNQYYKNNFIKARKVITIPDEEMRKEFEFEFGEPAGEETIKAIASTEPLNLEELGIERFESFFSAGGIISVPVSRRAVLVKKVQKNFTAGKFNWSEDTLVIRSYK